MTILKVTYGNPVASIKGICEHYQISDRTARMIVKELEQERGRYGDYTVLGDGALKRVNFLAFTDYWQFRKMLQDKNARKHVPVYSPQKVARSLTLCAAYPGTGKTYLLCYMAACVSTGRSFFNLIPFKDEPGKVIYLTSEDGIGDTIKKRLRICGANTDNVFTVPDGQNNLLFDSPEIEEFIKQIKPALMIFDPFQSYIGKEVDMNAANKTRERLNCIVSLAQKYNVAVVIICHFNKNGKGDAITRVMGSTDIMGICRSYIALGNVPGEEDIKYMSHEKSSLERKGKTILFEIDPDRGGIVYVGENALSMDDYTAIRNKKRAKDAPALEGAKQFIIDQMPDGSRLASEIVTLAKARHISERSLRRAREELQIIVQKTKEFPPKSLWVLPEKAGQPEEPQAVQETLPL